MHAQQPVEAAEMVEVAVADKDVGDTKQLAMR
jgi:hypothetical protein